MAGHRAWPAVAHRTSLGYGARLMIRRPEFPFAPKGVPVFYGWVILVVGAVGTLMSVPGQTVGVSVFTDFLIRDLGLTRTQLSLAYLFGTIGSAFILSVAGRAYDRYGARVVGAVVAFLLGAVLLVLSTSPRIVEALQNVAPNLPPVVPAFAFITIGFFLLRFLGQGALTLTSRNMVMKWFDRRRGLANAFLSVGISFGFSYAPLFLNGLIERHGWQRSWAGLGWVIGGAFAVAFLILARDNPEQCDLEPDGGILPAAKRASPESHPAADFTLAEARRTLTFWAYCLLLTMAALYTTGLTFHVVSIFAEAGMDRGTAVSIFLPASVISVFLSFLASWASDFIRLKYLLILQGLGLMLSIAALSLLSPGATLVLLIVGNGINGGMFGITSSVSWPRFYGRKHLGAVSGFAMGWTVGGSALGPYLFSLSLDVSGAYRSGACIVGAVVLACTVLATKADRPEAPARTEPGA